LTQSISSIIRPYCVSKKKGGKDLRIDCEVRREGAYPPLTSEPARVRLNKPVCKQSWKRGRMLLITHRFFASVSRNRRQYSSHLPTEGWPGWVGLDKYRNCNCWWTVRRQTRGQSSGGLVNSRTSQLADSEFFFNRGQII